MNDQSNQPTPDHEIVTNAPQIAPGTTTASASSVASGNAAIASTTASVGPVLDEISRKLDMSRQGRGAGPSRRIRDSRPNGVGVMGPRVRGGDEPAPPREVVDQAASQARSTGHRFDLMRYLRLRRRNDRT